jgi:hypothetical protein
LVQARPDFSRQDMPQQRSAPSINREEMVNDMRGRLASSLPADTPDWLRNRVQAPQPMRRGGQVHRGLDAIVPRRR